MRARERQIEIEADTEAEIETGTSIHRHAGIESEADRQTDKRQTARDMRIILTVWVSA